MKRTLCALLVFVLAAPVVFSATSDSITIPSFAKYKDNPVLLARKAKPGESKYFDSSAVTDPCIIYWEGRYHMWYTGWINWMGGSGRQGRIGYAISPDGKKWTRVDGTAGGIEAPGAVLGTGASNEYDGFSVQSPWVINDNGKLRMYYVAVDTKGKMTLGLAESNTGNYWNKKGQILMPTNELAFDGFQVGKCSVVRVNNIFKMWYEGQSKIDSRWRIGYATSYDGSTWTKNIGEKTGGAVLDLGDKITDFDNFTVRAPSVVFDGVYYYMWYDTSMRDEKTSQIGIAASVNGISFEKKGVSLDVGKIGDFDAQRVASPGVLKNGLVFYLYYCNYSDTNSGIGLATSGDLPANIGSGVVKLDCKIGDGFDFSLGNKTIDPTLADLVVDCGFGAPRMCGRYIRNAVDFADAECVPAEGYPAVSSVKENCQNIEVGATYAFKTINEQNYAKIKIEGIWQDPVDPNHYEITIKWMYQSNGSPCFIGGSKEPPSKPYNLNCVPGDRAIKLQWTPAFAPPGKVISYYVYRADEPGQAQKNKSPIHDFPVSLTQYTDTGLTNGKTYYYIVRTIDQFGNISEASNETFCQPKAVHPPTFPQPLPPAGGVPVPGDGSFDNPWVIEQNPWEFDWCGFQPQTLVIIAGTQYVADGNGCIHVSITLKPGGKNQIEYTIITPTGDTLSGSIWATLKDTNVNIELWIGRGYMMRNNQQMTLDQPPEIKFDRTMIPIRAVSEALDCQVDWDGNQKKITVSNCLNKIELWVNKPTAVVNGTPIAIDDKDKRVVPTVTKAGRTLVPFRFISETLGANVQYDANEKKVTIDYTPPKCPKNP
ncbi:MAG: stalk domain-containing protein [Caldisericales bacterium]|nr:hypothetical protein [bacterium]